MTSDARAVLTAATSEKAFQQTVIEMATALGFTVYHTWRSDNSPAGFPDIIAIRGNRLLAWELKSARGHLSIQQVDWLTAFSGVERVEIGVYRPADMDLVEALLRRGT